MRIAPALWLPASLAALVLAAPQDRSDYAEQLHLKPLPGRALYAGFNFTATTPAADYESQNFRFFPRSLGQILQHTHTAELHLRFALGRWDEENWGNRPRYGTREGGTGVELWAWLEAGSQREAEERWSILVNSLSGLFCASLNFIEQTKTVQPLLTFEPEGHVDITSPGIHLMHGMLPHEVVCTENLTPFLKLLPCKGKAGVASLLDGHKVFDANWQTMAIDARSKCSVSSEECEWEIEQTVDMVLDLDRSMRPRDNPIPRPPPIEEIMCDENKHYNSEDSCFPRDSDAAKDWSLSQIFGRPIKGSCPLGDRSDAVDVFLDTTSGQRVELIAHSDSNDGAPILEVTDTRKFRLQASKDFDIKVPAMVNGAHGSGDSLLRASRQMTGYGQERGGMHAVITNPHDKALQVVYLESLPWFLRPYVHTLKVNGATIEKMFYKPAADRRQGTHLELLLEIPPHSEIDLSYDFEKAILRYTEYPPDANRGFDVAPAVIRILPTGGSEDDQGSYLRTTSLLLPLPTPDFSMPYNVIILTSTVIALGFGSIFNLLIRRFVLAEEVPKSPLAKTVKQAIARLKGRQAEAISDAVPGEGGPEPSPSNTATGLESDTTTARLRKGKGKEKADG